jgi:hypothetical protein
MEKMRIEDVVEMDLACEAKDGQSEPDHVFGNGGEGWHHLRPKILGYSKN